MNNRTTPEDRLYYWAFLGVVVAAAVSLWVKGAPAQPTSIAPLPPAGSAPLPQPAPLPPLSPDHQVGFCAGWNAAAQVEQQRYSNWRALVMLGQPTPDSPTGVVVGSVPIYVLIQPLPPGASLNMVDGRMVTCPTAENKK